MLGINGELIRHVLDAQAHPRQIISDLRGREDFLELMEGLYLCLAGGYLLES